MWVSCIVPPFVSDCTLWSLFLTASRSLLAYGWQRLWASGSWKQHCLAATEALVGPCGRWARSRLLGPNGCGMCSRSHSSMYALGVIVVCTPIVCMPEVMHVWQQVAALGKCVLAWEMQRKHWVGDLDTPASDTPAAALYLRARIYNSRSMSSKSIKN